MARVEDRCRVDGWQITGLQANVPAAQKQPEKSLGERPTVEQLSRNNYRISSALLGLTVAALMVIILFIPSCA